MSKKKKYYVGFGRTYDIMLRRMTSIAWTAENEFRAAFTAIDKHCVTFTVSTAFDAGFDFPCSKQSIGDGKFNIFTFLNLEMDKGT